MELPRKNNIYTNISRISIINFLTQAIVMFGFAINSRYYGAAIIGTYSVFKAYSSIISIGSSGNLEQSFFIEKRKYQYKYIFLTIFLLATIVSLLSAFFLSLIKTEYVFLIAITVISETLIKTINSLNISQNRILFISVCNLLYSPINPILFFISYKIFGKLELNLILISTFSSLLFATFITLITFKKLKIKVTLNDLIKWKHFKFVFNRYSKFIRYSMTGEILRTLAFKAPTIVFERVFGKEVAGYYGVANRIALLPIQVIVSTVTQIYISKMSLFKKQKSKLWPLTNKLLKLLAILATIGIIIFFLLGKELLLFLLGYEFETVYYIIRSLIPYALGLIIVNPLFSIFTVFEKQENLFKMKLMVFFSSILSFGLTIYFNNYMAGLYIFSIILFLIYILYGYIAISLIKSYDKKSF